MRGGVYNGPNGEQLYGDGSEVEPMTVAKPITEHPAVRAAREIYRDAFGYGDVHESWSPPVSKIARRFQRHIKSAYAERDAKVLKALEWALSQMQNYADEHDGHDPFGLACGCCDGALPIPHSGGCRLRAAIAEMRGEGQ